jgi:hypothetical protein
LHRLEEATPVERDDAEEERLLPGQRLIGSRWQAKRDEAQPR